MMPARSAVAMGSTIVVTMTFLSPAQAPKAADCATYLHQREGPIYYVMPYLDMGGSGRHSRYTKAIDTYQTLGQVGHMMSIIAFKPETDDMPFERDGKKWYSGHVTAVDDGRSHFTAGWGSFHTAYGPTVWATQFNGAVGCAAKRGRWGTWNLIKGRFRPSSQWFPVAVIKASDD